MALYLVGLGLADEHDITIRGRKIVEDADLIFLESYTSILGVDKDRLEAAYGKTIQIADRELVEQDADDIILGPIIKSNKKVVLLVVGDPMCATTHTDLYIRAKHQYNISVTIIHNASIMNVLSDTGLQFYRFGQTISIPFFDDNWKPTSFYEKIRYNRLGGMHTLCLLDIKVKEPDYKALIGGGHYGGGGCGCDGLDMRRKQRYLPPRFMTIRTAAEQLLEVENRMKLCAYDGSTTLCVGMARMGQSTQHIRAGTLNELIQYSSGQNNSNDDENGDNDNNNNSDSDSDSDGFGGPLHSLIICAGQLHDLELEMLKEFLIEGSTFQLATNTASDETTKR